MPLNRTSLIIGGVARSQTKHCISTTKHAIGLKLEHGLVLWYTIYQTQFSEKIAYRGFTQIWSHMAMQPLVLYMHYLIADYFRTLVCGYGVQALN